MSVESGFLNSLAYIVHRDLITNTRQVHIGKWTQTADDYSVLIPIEICRHASGLTTTNSRHSLESRVGFFLRDLCRTYRNLKLLERLNPSQYPSLRSFVCQQFIFDCSTVEWPSRLKKITLSLVIKWWDGHWSQGQTKAPYWEKTFIESSSLQIKSDTEMQVGDTQHWLIF